MSISANCIWECRSVTGSDNNGGGYVSGGTDYSQQASPILAITDLTSVLSSTTITSIIGGFTSAMVGNIIHILAGTNFIPGFYQIITYTDTNNVILDRACTTGGAGITGVANVGGALQTIQQGADIAIAGNIVYIKAEAVITLTAQTDFDTNAGTSLGLISFYGYTSTRNDNGNISITKTGSVNDLFKITKSYLRFDNFNMYGSNRYLLNMSTGNNLYINNCIFHDNTLQAVYLNGSIYTTVINSEFYNCWMGIHNGQNVNVYGCYFHNLTTHAGVNLYGQNNMIANCIFDTVLYGIISEGSNDFIVNNTFYNSLNYAINYTNINCLPITIINNIFNSCSIGIRNNAGAKFNNLLVDYNCFYNNGTDVLNIIKGSHDFTADPQFVDAPNGNFTPGVNIKAKGFPGSFPGGLTTGYLDVGAVQRVESGTLYERSYISIR